MHPIDAPRDKDDLPECFGVGRAGADQPFLVTVVVADALIFDVKAGQVPVEF